MEKGADPPNFNNFMSHKRQQQQGSHTCVQNFSVLRKHICSFFLYLKCYSVRCLVYLQHVCLFGCVASSCGEFVYLVASICRAFAYVVVLYVCVCLQRFCLHGCVYLQQICVLVYFHVLSYVAVCWALSANVLKAFFSRISNSHSCVSTLN